MKQLSLSIMMYVTMLGLVMTSCSSPTPQPSRVEEITFQSGSFKVVGDLRLPGGIGPFPVVLFVHGDGPMDRLGSGYYLPVMDRMLRAGYATFAWDKPGTGESTGELSPGKVQSQRAQILLDAIAVMKTRPEIHPGRIGLWGGSQAGYVMPRALAESRDIAFMICISCPAMSSYDQMAAQVTALALCKGVPEEQADQETALLAELDRARFFTTFEEYLEYRRVLNDLVELVPAPTNRWPTLTENSWQTNPLNPQGLWNPISVIEQTKIPILAIFGDRDRQMDPLHGAFAYRRALELAGNPQSRVELFPGANHGILVSETGCPDDDGQMINQWLEDYVKSLGYKSMSEAQEKLLENPYQPGLLKDFPFAPKYLDTMEEWLKGLRDSR
jgi:pimeloyl-ACP methyl ester carboxylesterase